MNRIIRLRMFAYMRKNRLLLFVLLSLIAITSCDEKNKVTATGEGLYANPALAEVNNKINENPEDDKLYYQRGVILHELSQTDKVYDSLAIEDIKKAISLDSSRAQYYSAIGDILFERKDISGSINWLEKAIKLNPEDPRARMKIAKMFVYLKNYPKAFSEINTVLRQDVQNPEGYFLKGMIYKDLRDTAKAISSFQTALEVAPKYRPAMVQLGLLYSSKKNPLALQYLDNAFKLDTLDAFPLYARGMYYQDMEDFEQAKNEYKNTIMYDKQYADAYFNTGWILMRQDSLEKAWRQFDLVTRIQPDNHFAYYNRGLVSELMGKKEEARNDYKQALTFYPDYGEAKEALNRVGQ